MMKRPNKLMKLLVLSLSVLAVGALQAETPKPKPFPEFSAKRQKPPKKGSRKRITVQITPQGPKAGAVISGKAKGGGVAKPSASSYDWFWETVSSDLNKSSGRYQSALNRLSNPPGGKGVRAPRLQTLHTISQAHGVDILKATIGKKVSPALVLAVIAVESAGKTTAVSSAGAQGLMQLIPDTAARFGVTDSTDPAQNIKGGVAYLEWLIKHFQGDPIFALAGYNAGENAVGKHDGIPPYPETRAYVPKVLAAWYVARGLCLTPPELLTDGCVFTVMGAPSNG